MGLFDMFNSESREKRAIAKWGKRLMDKYQQPDERKRAINALVEVGTDESITALLGRYKYRTEQTIVDEEEKQLVFDSVVALGDKAVPSLKKYIASEQSVYWPVKALRTIAGDEATANHLVDSLTSIEDTFGSNRARRESLVDNLREFSDQEAVFDLLLTLAHDEDEEVVIRAIDALSARVGDPQVPEVVVPILVKPETSHRLRTLALEMIIEQGWNVKKFKKVLGDILPQQYFIDDTGTVKRR